MQGQPAKNFARFPNYFLLLTMAARKMKKRDGKMPQGNCARLMSDPWEWHCGTMFNFCPGGWAHISKRIHYLLVQSVFTIISSMSMSSKSFFSVGACCKSDEGWRLPYMGYIGICSPKGYGFQLFWSQILFGVCILVLNAVCLLIENTKQSTPTVRSAFLCSVSFSRSSFFRSKIG